MNQPYIKPTPEPPAIRDAMAKASEREEGGLPVYDFSSGNIGRLVGDYQVFEEFSLKTGEVPEGFLGVAEAIKRGLRKSFVESPVGLSYSPTGGTEAQKKNVIKYFQQVHNVPLGDEQTERVIVTAGGQQAMAVALRSISPDTKVLVPKWDYAPVVGIASDEPWELMKLPGSGGEGFTLDSLKENANKGSVFYTSMPNNPSGYVSADKLSKAVEIMVEKGGAVIWDAPYLFTMFELRDGEASFAPEFLKNELEGFSEIAEEYSEHMCILSSISKTCLSAGLRYGFATASEKWIDNMNAIVGRENLSSPTPSFIIGNEILTDFVDGKIRVHEWASRLLASRFNYLLENDIPLLLPENGKYGALYALMETSEAGSKVNDELAKEGIITVPAKPFYGDEVNAVRLSLVSVPFVEGDKLWEENVDKLAALID